MCRGCVPDLTCHWWVRSVADHNLFCPNRMIIIVILIMGRSWTTTYFVQTGWSSSSSSSWVSRGPQPILSKQDDHHRHPHHGWVADHNIFRPSFIIIANNSMASLMYQISHHLAVNNAHWVRTAKRQQNKRKLDEKTSDSILGCYVMLK